MISVIIPIYNGARFLTSALESVRNQKYADFECICVNDGSTDESSVIVQNYVEKDPRFRLLEQANKGDGAARNRGLEDAKGEYVFFMDSDDVLDPSALKRLHELAIEYECDVVMGSKQNFISEDRLSLWNGADEVIVVSQSPMDDFWDCSIDMIYAVWGKLYLRAALKGIVFPEDVFGANDYVFTARLHASIKRYLRTTARLYGYRSHPDNMTAKKPFRYIMGMLRSREMVYDEIVKNEANACFVRALFGKEIIKWPVKEYFRQSFDKCAYDELKEQVIRMRSKNIFKIVGIRNKLKMWCFENDCRALMRLLSPVLIFKKIILRKNRK